VLFLTNHPDDVQYEKGHTFFNPGGIFYNQCLRGRADRGEADHRDLLDPDDLFRSFPGSPPTLVGH